MFPFHSSFQTTCFTEWLRFTCRVPSPAGLLATPRLQPARLFCPWVSEVRALEWVPPPPPGDLPDPGVEPVSLVSPALWVDPLPVCYHIDEAKKRSLSLWSVKKREALKPPMKTSLVVQWLRICLPIQGTWVQSLVQEDSTCCRTTKSIHHNYCPERPGPGLYIKRSLHSEKPKHCR